MKKVFILLFPQEEYLGTRKNSTHLFNECIKQRHIKKGYQFFVVRFKGSDLGIVSLTPDKIIDADITFDQSNSRGSTEWKYADFNLISSHLHIDDFSQITIGGFHCFDCVEKFASEIYKLNKNVIVDTDLTEQFWSVSQHQDRWDIAEFKPEQKLDRVFARKNCPTDMLKQIVDRYKNPIWGISQETIESLETRIQSNGIDENSY